MGGVAVEDEEDLARDVVEEELQVLDEAVGAHPPREAEMQLALRRDRGDHVEAAALACSFEDRRPSDFAPGCPRMVIGAHPGLVAEEDLGPCRLGRLGDPRVLLGPPALHSLRVLPVGSCERALGGEAHPLQQVGHTLAAHLDPEALRDQRADHVTGSEREVEVQLMRLLPDDQLAERSDLAQGQLRWPSRGRPDLEGVLALVLIRSPPPIDRRAHDLEGRGDVLWMGTPLDEADHLGPHLLEPAAPDPLRPTLPCHDDVPASRYLEVQQ